MNIAGIAERFHYLAYPAAAANEILTAVKRRSCLQSKKASKLQKTSDDCIGMGYVKVTFQCQVVLLEALVSLRSSQECLDVARVQIKGSRAVIHHRFVLKHAREILHRRFRTTGVSIYGYIIQESVVMAKEERLDRSSNQQLLTLCRAVLIPSTSDVRRVLICHHPGKRNPVLSLAILLSSKGSRLNLCTSPSTNSLLPTGGGLGRGWRGTQPCLSCAPRPRGSSEVP